MDMKTRTVTIDLQIYEYVTDDQIELGLDSMIICAQIGQLPPEGALRALGRIFDDAVVVGVSERKQG